MAQVTAQLNNLRISPRKVRLVSRLLKGMGALDAKSQLAHTVKRSSGHISKLLDSALSNAENNLGLVKENLFIKNLVVNEGPKLKRFRPKGFHLTSPIEKKTSRIKIVLEEKVTGLRSEKSKVVKDEAGELITENGEKGVNLGKSKKPDIKKDTSKKGIFRGIKKVGRKFFRRKAM